MSHIEQTLSTKCFDMLTSAILSGEFLPGERLLSEDLKKRYAVGMSPIREALSKLAASRLVTFEEHKGFSVTKLNVAQILDDIKTFVEIECLCLKHAIENSNDLWEEGIVATLHSLSKMEASKELDYFAWAPINMRFHDALVAACPLQSLMEIRNNLYQRHQYYIMLCYKFIDHAVFHANYQEHQQLAKATLARNTKDALNILTYHLTAGVDELVSKLLSRNLIHS